MCDRRSARLVDQFDVGFFRSFGKLFNLSYKGPASKVDAGNGTSTYIMDGAGVPAEPSSWPPAQRPVYWRHETVSMFFSSILEVLQFTGRWWELNCDRYDALGKQVGWIFLGATGTMRMRVDRPGYYAGVQGSRDLPQDVSKFVFWREALDTVRVRSFELGTL